VEFTIIIAMWNCGTRAAATWRAVVVLTTSSRRMPPLQNVASKYVRAFAPVPPHAARPVDGPVTVFGEDLGVRP
jgi:hypothetical protein